MLTSCTAVLHGNAVSYRRGGEGQAVVLLHGIARQRPHLGRRHPALAERYTVLAPDLLGHGQSAKPRGDYSLGAYATGVRDLLHRARPPTGRRWSATRSVAASRCSSPTSSPSSCERLVLVDQRRPRPRGPPCSARRRAARRRAGCCPCHRPHRRHAVRRGPRAARPARPASGHALAEIAARLRLAQRRRGARCLPAHPPRGHRPRRPARRRHRPPVPRPGRSRRSSSGVARDRLIPVAHAAHFARRWCRPRGSRCSRTPPPGTSRTSTKPARFATVLVPDFVAGSEPWAYDPARVRELMLAGAGGR